MLLGARIALGCTSGHGIAGGSELSLESFSAICCMFGFGIITGLIFRLSGYESVIRLNTNWNW